MVSNSSINATCRGLRVCGSCSRKCSTMWPRPSDPKRGGPLPRSTFVVPGCAGACTTRGSVVPCRVGISTSPPSKACRSVKGTSRCTSSSTRRKRSCGNTFTVTKRWPALPPRVPAWPAPATRSSMRCCTPAGTLTRTSRGCRRVPSPRQSRQGWSNTSPVPWHRWHGTPMLRMPRSTRCTPEPRQTRQVDHAVPSRAPVPRHSLQVCRSISETTFSQPCTASRKLTSTWLLTSSPRIAADAMPCGRCGVARPKMS
mmetsp:Transcript_78896/g.218272  ORF Transcript_78896/g.218272 Transcript_78896/m.218272 type:complete len:256 (-) Transcript_78896:515-1282(-)